MIWELLGNVQSNNLFIHKGEVKWLHLFGCCHSMSELELCGSLHQKVLKRSINRSCHMLIFQQLDGDSFPLLKSTHQLVTNLQQRSQCKETSTTVTIGQVNFVATTFGFIAGGVRHRLNASCRLAGGKTDCPYNSLRIHPFFCQHICRCVYVSMRTNA